jgi:hypothetical protein
MKTKMLLTMILLCFSALSPAWGANPIEVEDYLREFHSNPKKVMNDQLLRRDETGRVVEYDPVFSEQAISNQEFMTTRFKIRQQICERSGQSCDEPQKSKYLAEPMATDRVENFLYQINIVRRLNEMEMRGLTKTVLETPPWSESYWPTQKGALGRRYSDPSFPNSTDWQLNYDYFLAVPRAPMSPAEKYDYLVGDSTWSLSDASWQKGVRLKRDYGTVPGWMGICHGWAPASFMFPQPKRGVTVNTYHGGSVTFSPSDIGALAALLWAEGPPPVRFIGDRCWKPNPVEDEVGRVVDPNCFATNPGTWHVGIVNQLGIAKRSFVYDATYDYQVWNFPVYAYQYSYFNPQTLAVSKKLATAIVPIQNFKLDKFKSYRSPRAKYIVGIAMDVSYAKETEPSSSMKSGKSVFRTVRYVYDLELDETYKIIGGEWYSNHHPDFMWNPVPGSRAMSRGEKEAGLSVRWDGTGPIPVELIQAARKSSPYDEPVAGIIEALIELSQREGE